MPSTQKQIAKHLDMSERNVRDVLNALAEKHELDREWWKKTTLDDIRVKYLRDMREKAAGRGGNDQVNLTKQRAEESQVKTAMMRLEYNEKIGLLIAAEDAADVITGWCVVANREYLSGFMKLVGEIQSAYKIEVDNKLVENIAGPTLKRIQDHASDASGDLVEGGGDIHSA